MEKLEFKPFSELHFIFVVENSEKWQEIDS